jgi:hypothetical protein
MKSDPARPQIPLRKTPRQLLQERRLAPAMGSHEGGAEAEDGEALQ